MSFPAVQYRGRGFDPRYEIGDIFFGSFSAYFGNLFKLGPFSKPRHRTTAVFGDLPLTPCESGQCRLSNGASSKSPNTGAVAWGRWEEAIPFLFAMQNTSAFNRLPFNGIAESRFPKSTATRARCRPFQRCWSQIQIRRCRCTGASVNHFKMYTKIGNETSKRG